MNKYFAITTIWALLSAQALAATDPVVLRFATVGDSRTSLEDPDPSTLPLSAQDRIWLQNSKALGRILRTVRAQQANLLFFNGDMINGYGKAEVPKDTSSVAAVVASDLMQTYRQYAYWRGMVADLLETGTYVVPVMGNHESQWKAAGKIAQPENEDAWRANMGDLILDARRMQQATGIEPTFINTRNNAALDKLPSDQSQLSYSFDLRDSHFAVMNTDPTGADSHAPTQWLAADLAAARARGAKQLFVFGHKPAFTYYYGADPAHPLPTSPSGLEIDPAARDGFWQVIQQYGATYLCGHQHIFNISQHGKAWQVLVGSGGSPFEAKIGEPLRAASDRYYAWATVSIHASGAVDIEAYGFDEHFGATRKLRTIKLAATTSANAH